MEKRQKILKWLNNLINLFLLICLLVIVYFILQVFAVTSFKIPTDSMVPTLLPGDCILVDKCSKGARLFDVAAVLNGEEFTIHRMPGWRNYRHNDVLVFNFPYPVSWDSINIDVMLYYVKRCIALPGDTVEIRDGHYKVKGFDNELKNIVVRKDLSFFFYGDTVTAPSSFPWDPVLGWTMKEFGPLPVPAKGDVVLMDSLSWMLYHQLITWEQKQPLRIDESGHIYIGDSLVRKYRFRENYYFMAGDNSCNSQDSRYWGLLPEPFIVGKAVRIWKSVDRETDKIRWDRIWKRIE